MMRQVNIVVAGLLLVGCTQNTAPSSGPTPVTSAVTSDTTPTTAPGSVAGGSAADPAPHAAPSAAPAAAPTTVFEWNQDGKTYVFRNLDDMQAFQNGKQQAKVVERTDLAAGGKTVVIEASDDAEAATMAAAFLKLHPLPK